MLSDILLIYIWFHFPYPDHPLYYSTNASTHVDADEACTDADLYLASPKGCYSYQQLVDALPDGQVYDLCISVDMYL